METNQRSLLTRLRSAARVSMALAVLFAGINSASLAQGTAGLLGVNPGFPQVDAAGSGQQCTYDSVTSTLTLMALTNSYLPNPNNFENINNGMVTITAVLDGSGNPTSGTLTVNGTTNSGLTDPLLTANITAIGLQDTNASATIGTDRADVRATPTGGSIFTGPDWPAGTFDVTTSIFMTGSDYAGSVATDWSCGNANMTIGAENFPPPAVEVSIDAQPGGCVRIDGNGVVPVVIFGTANLNVDDIERDTLLFQGLEIGTRGGTDEPDCEKQQFNNDGFLDLVCNFQDDRDLWDADGLGDDNIATLWGELENGTPIMGSEEICLVGKKKSKALSPLLLGLLLPLAMLRRRLRRA